MLLRIEENANCEAVDGRVFNEVSTPRPVRQVLRARDGQEVWCSITGLEDGSHLCPVFARKVQDSGEGTCYLVYGGAWGVRLKAPECTDDWSLNDVHQWGETFLLLPPDGQDLRFLDDA